MYYKGSLGLFSTNSACEANVSRHHGDAPGMDGTDVGVFKEADDIGLGSLLQGKNSGALEANATVGDGVELLCNFAHEALKRQLADQELARLLVLTDFLQSLAVGANASLAWSLRLGQLGGTLSWEPHVGFLASLAPNRLRATGCGLFGAGHGDKEKALMNNELQNSRL